MKTETDSMMIVEYEGIKFVPLTDILKVIEMFKKETAKEIFADIENQVVGKGDCGDRFVDEYDIRKIKKKYLGEKK